MMPLNEICLILDLETFTDPFSKKPITREFGMLEMVRPVDYHGLVNLSHSYSKDDLNTETNRYVKKRIHGLSFYPRPMEYKKSQVFEPDDVGPFLRSIYDVVHTIDRSFVAYKGGCCERILLEELGIPSIDLERMDCPKASILKDNVENLETGLEWSTSTSMDCGCHVGGSTMHCPKDEVYLYKAWINAKLNQSFKTLYKVIVLN